VKSLPRPPWLADLPNLDYSSFRDLPATAFSYWSNGRPVGSTGRVTIDASRAVVLIMRRACLICGYPLARGYPVYVIHTSGLPHPSRSGPEIPPRDKKTCSAAGWYTGGGWYGDMFITHLGASHLSCAYFTAAACPFMKYPASVTRHQGDGRDVVRGDVDIVGYSKISVVFFDQPIPAAVEMDGRMRRCGFHGVVSRTPHGGSWKDLLEVYDSVIEADAEIIDTSEPRLYWTDNAEDIAELSTLYRRDGQMAKWARRVPGAGLKLLAVP
jgi:hypothetical protein